VEKTVMIDGSMKSTVPGHILDLPRVGSRQIDELTQTLRHEGKSVLPLTGYPTEKLPDAILDLAVQSLRHIEHPPARGLLELRQAISEYLEKELRHPFDPHQEILITHGAMHALNICLQTILSPGDEVVLFSPCFFFGPMIELAGGVPLHVALSESEGYRFRPDLLESAITPRTKAVLLNSPCNPTGYRASLEELQKIIRVAEKYDLLILSDESYDTLIYDGLSHVSVLAVEAARPRTLLVRSFTKSFSLADWRVGYIVCPPSLSKHVLKMLEWNVLFCGYLNQKVATLVLRSDKRWLQDVPQTFQRNRDRLYERLAEIEEVNLAKPAGNPFLFVNISRLGIPDEEFSLRLLREYGIPTTPGTLHQSPGHIRLGFGGDPEVIEQAADRFTTAVKAWRR
jgi:aminotransferase